MLSINFIVILILALAVLGIGFNLSYRFLKKAETMKAQLDAQTEAQIESYLAAGEIVTIPITKKMISDGGAVFGLGVLNILGEQTFSIEVECGPKYNVAGGVENYPCNQDINNETWIQTTLTNWKFSLKQNEDKKIAILIAPQSPTTGLYSFIVRVYYSGTSDLYGDPQPIYVEVP